MRRGLARCFYRRGLRRDGGDAEDNKSSRSGKAQFVSVAGHQSSSFNAH